MTMTAKTYRYLEEDEIRELADANQKGNKKKGRRGDGGIPGRGLGEVALDEHAGGLAETAIEALLELDRGGADCRALRHEVEEAEAGAEVGGSERGTHQDQAGQAHGGRVVGESLVDLGQEPPVDLIDDLQTQQGLDHIFGGHKALGPAVLVDHQGNALTLVEQKFKQFRQGHAARHCLDVAFQRVECLITAMAGIGQQQVIL